jgi:DNA end-binding protein Ku
MPPRSLGSGTISFGLVSIPVKLYPAASSQSISFHLLHAKCGNRIRQQRFCPVCNEVVEREGLVKGYEFAKDQYVRVSTRARSARRRGLKAIEISEFVPLSEGGSVYFEKATISARQGRREGLSFVVGRDASRQVALAKFVLRGEKIWCCSLGTNGLMLHTMYFADEVRNFDEISKGESAKISGAETNLALRLIDELSSEQFNPEQYEDEYRQRVLNLVNTKAEGKEITVAEPQAHRAQVIDLMEALKESLGKKVAKEKKPAVSAKSAEPEKGKKRAQSAKK